MLDSSDDEGMGGLEAGRRPGSAPAAAAAAFADTLLVAGAPTGGGGRDSLADGSRAHPLQARQQQQQGEQQPARLSLALQVQAAAMRRIAGALPQHQALEAQVARLKEVMSPGGSGGGGSRPAAAAAAAAPPPRQ